MSVERGGEAVRVVMLGAPTDVNSSYRRGPAQGPAMIREVLASDVGNSSTESGAEFGSEIDFSDGGDIPIAENAEDEIRIIAKITEVARTGAVPITIGGDHSITYPIVRALAAIHGPLHILHIDAHPDLYEDFEGNQFSHASPFARIMENALATRLVQVGVRTLNKHQREQANRFGVEIIPMQNFTPHWVPVLEGPLYISIDLDGLDPSYAPGVSHHEPGGLSTREVINVLQRQTGRLIGADVVELNPEYDVSGITAALAAKLVKEIAGLVALRNTSR